MAAKRKPGDGMVAALAVTFAALASVLGVGFSPQEASAAAPAQGTVTITTNCYDVGLGSIQAVLTSPAGIVQSVSGNMSLWAKSPTGMVYGGQVSLTGSVAVIYHVYPGTYELMLSGHDTQGTTYSYNGTLVMPACDNAFVGIQPDPNPDGGYLTLTNSAAVMSDGPHHASDNPSYLVLQPHAAIVGMGAVYSEVHGDGYDFAAADGAIYAINDAPFDGSAAGLPLHAPIVGMALTPDQGGYWLVAADGGVFAFGDAHFDGSMAGLPLNQPIVGMSVDQATGGYWLVGRDGAVYAFDAPFYGSVAPQDITWPVVGMESAPNGTGYRLVAADGGVFSFNEPFDGSMSGQTMVGFAVGIAEDPVSGGYWLTTTSGAVYSFNAPFYGIHGNAPA
jgi:hypothetical protein